MASFTVTGVGGLQSATFHNPPPVEWGRAGGTVVTLAVVGNGTATATSQAGPLATTCDQANGAGLTVSTTAAAGVVTAISVTVGGDGYRIGDIITVTGGDGDDPITGRVTKVSYTN